MIRYQVFFALERSKAKALAEIHPILLHYFFPLDLSFDEESTTMVGLIVERWSEAMEFNLPASQYKLSHIAQYVSHTLVSDAEGIVVFTIDPPLNNSVFQERIDLADGLTLRTPDRMSAHDFQHLFSTQVQIEGRPFFTGHTEAGSMRLLLDNRY